jgi:hypothetical protein
MMMVLLVSLFVLAGAVWFIVLMRENQPTPPVDPEQAVKAAVELHRIRRRLDAAWTKSEQRRDSARLRWDIAEALKEPGDSD